MKVGHPYLTDTLDRKRLEQRRLLRSMPDWFFDPTRLAPKEWTSAEIRQSDRPYVETLLRRLTDELAEDAPLTELRGRWVADMDADRLAEFILHDTVRPPGNLQDAWDGLIRMTSDRTRLVEIKRELDLKFLPVVAKLILLLTWADALADDGYVDPRVAATWERQNQLVSTSAS